MAERPTNPPEAMSRGSILHGFRAAALDLWGERGLLDIASRISDEARAASVDSIVLPVSWYPMRFHMEWHRAVWEGPADRIDAAFCRFMQRAIEIGYGRMKRMVLGIASPEQLILRAPALWDAQHTHGKLTAEATSRGATLRLRGNPVTTQAISRRAMAEAYRTITSLSRATNVRETHGLEADDTLVVRITWER